MGKFRTRRYRGLRFKRGKAIEGDERRTLERISKERLRILREQARKGLLILGKKDAVQE